MPLKLPAYAKLSLPNLEALHLQSIPKEGLATFNPGARKAIVVYPRSYKTRAHACPFDFHNSHREGSLDAGCVPVPTLSADINFLGTIAKLNLPKFSSSVIDSDETAYEKSGVRLTGGQAGGGASPAATYCAGDGARETVGGRERERGEAVGLEATDLLPGASPGT